jgi:hypothetical protein
MLKNLSKKNFHRSDSSDSTGEGGGVARAPEGGTGGGAGAEESGGGATRPGSKQAERHARIRAQTSAIEEDEERHEEEEEGKEGEELGAGGDDHAEPGTREPPKQREASLVDAAAEGHQHASNEKSPVGNTVSSSERATPELVAVAPGAEARSVGAATATALSTDGKSSAKKAGVGVGGMSIAMRMNARKRANSQNSDDASSVGGEEKKEENGGGSQPGSRSATPNSAAAAAAAEEEEEKRKLDHSFSERLLYHGVAKQVRIRGGWGGDGGTKGGDGLAAR